MPYLSFLPTETLQHIVEYLAPVNVCTKEYYARQTTLRSLCLTSKRLLSISQPFLFSVVPLNTEEK
jgi:hypothetical protein